MSDSIKTTVVNKHHQVPFDVYIGRGSEWGNPFSHMEGTQADYVVEDRETAILKYENYLLSNPKLYLGLRNLKGKTLQCYCSPQSCHGDILSKYADLLGNRAWGRYPSYIINRQRETYPGPFSNSFKDSIENSILVFGSNTEGRHGKGVALEARNHWGAIYGQSKGLQGRSYAIITKDLTKSSHPSISKEYIKSQIKELYSYAVDNPNNLFIIPYTNHLENLNNYSNYEMAEMFYSKDIPDNILFDNSFFDLILEVDRKSNFYEVSSKGDKRFSAFYARLKDGRTIEEAYQLDVKGYRVKDSGVYLPLLTLHSGGANGSDSKFDEIGRTFGLINANHYYIQYETPLGNVEVSKDYLIHKEQIEFDLVSANANLQRRYPTSKEYVNNLLRRNWFQIHNSKQTFAIGVIDDDYKTVEGGTGWAIELSKMKGHPTYVFTLDENRWYYWDRTCGIFRTCEELPKITESFAGIGTREITEEGIKAIYDLYDRSVSKDISYDYKDGKGKDPINPKYIIRDVHHAGVVNQSITEMIDYEELYQDYLKLWRQWANENKSLILELAMKSIGKTLTDMFATSPVNQARALTEVLNELKL